MALNRHIKDRRGVLLLIVLALLALFGVTAVGFYIVATSGKRSADATVRTARDTERPEDRLNEALAQVLHGSNRPMSVLQNHSLLEDLYGNNTPGIITVTPATGGGYIQIQMPQAHLRVGSWLTMVSGSAAPEARKIEQYTVNTTTGVTTAILKEFTTTPSTGDRYIVQNAPWRGQVRENTSIPATIRSICGGQLVEFTAVSPPANSSVPATLIPLRELYPFAGAVLTMLSGPAAGCSTRILGFVPLTGTSDGGQLRVAAFDGVSTSDLVTYIQNGNTCEYVINGSPFSGTGAGLNLTAMSGERLNQTMMGEDANGNGTLDAGEDTNNNGVLDSYPRIDYALAPNPVHFSPSTVNGYGDPAGPGGANEDYDAVDYQNMLLSTGQAVDTNGDGTADTFIPSLHRAQLVRYWFQLMVNNSAAFNFSWPAGWNDTQKWQALCWPDKHATSMGSNDRATMLAVIRRIVLRPLSIDHQNFTGSNANFNPIWDGVTADGSQWDIDNDGDGVPDSIWVDLGLPARSTPDGRLYKPLFAILCKDLDGCLNINAHGSSAQLATAYSTATSGPYPGATAAVRLPRGGGYGPADVCLTKVLNSQDVTNLLRGRNSGGVTLEGRYGESFASGAEAGVTGSTSKLSLLKRFEVPQNYTDIFTSGNVDTAKLRSYCAPPDFWARGTVALDYRGQPFFDAIAWTNENTNNPYDLNLTHRLAVQDSSVHTNADNPFAPAELEWLLRPYDLDVPSLASRLRGLDQNGSLFNNRHALTTDSWDIPSPSNTVIPEQSTASRAHASKLADLLRARLVEEHGWSEPLSLAYEKQIITEMSQLLSWDLATNLRMDINRPFGNGRDDNANQTVDESEEGGSQQAWSDVFGSAVTFQLTNGVTAATDPKTARQLYARHLFVLAMLLWDRGYLQPTTTGTLDAGLSEGQKRELTIRRLAQWAINVVDFRDADSVMTPFEYDKNPFDGWGVDGNLTTDESVSTCPDRRVVWGCEAPELLITETLAFHDRRVMDTNLDSGIQKKRFEWDGTNWVPKDPDLDQPRIPQGSAFFELYCTHNPTNVVVPGDLYTYDSTNKWRLKLDALSPADGAGRTYPVWRMVISDFKSVTGQDVKQRLADRPDSVSLEPRQSHGTSHPETDDNFNLQRETIGGDMVDVDIERIVWFANQSPTGYEDEDRIFYRRSGSTYLAPGRYLVIGPRQTTSIGALATALGTPSDRQIQLTSSGVTVKDSSKNDQYLEVLKSDFSNTTALVQPVETMIVAADPPSLWTNKPLTAPMGIGINISEPLPEHNYYTEPTQDNSNNSGIRDAYGSIPSGPFPDQPEDSQNGRPLKDAGLLATGTTEHCKTVFLQRLANPKAAYHPVTNPYRTVDWAPMDLTVFNGEDRKPADPGYPDNWDPDDPRAESAKKVYLATCQRNGSNQNLWKQQWTSVPAVSTWKAAYAGTGNDVFTPNFTFDPLNAVDRYHTLGFLNKDFGAPWKYADLPAATGSDSDAYKKMYTGDPQNPFPWLAWNNRPFANCAELLLVPSCSSARLAHEFSPAKSDNPYDATNAAGFSYPFGHLGNFFQASDNADESPHLYRLLEYLRVPSPFVGLEKVLNPSTTYFGNTASSDTVLLRPPFNFLSDYREPGRININTIFQPNVWNAVLNGYPDPTAAAPTPPYSSLVQSRAGHGASVVYPTLFANPFRSAGSSQFVPPLRTGSATMARRGVNATLLRARGADPDDTSAGHGDQPLFFAADTTNEYRRTDRNASFAYQGLQRLSNVLTTRSNVYAVWVSVGYFEVEQQPTGYDPSVYPDGYALGQELGSDTGEVRRHRAFYIIDRSIPVGFRRGEDLNSGNCVLLKRFIE